MGGEGQCIICGNLFRASALVDGKCPVCKVKYPKAKSKEDIKPKERNAIATLLSEKRVEEIVYDILSKAGINRVPCEKCGTMFFKMSPAQKHCETCAAKDKK